MSLCCFLRIGADVLVNGLVNNSVIHLRREPSSKTELVTQALLGTPVRILKTEGGKSLIQIPDGYLGWVNESEVHSMAPGGSCSLQGGRKDHLYGPIWFVIQRA